MLRRQMTIIGHWTFSNMGQAECASFVAEKGVPVDDIFTHRWSLSQAAEAYDLFDRGVGGKGVFLM
jgi:threonine dehydrogenase-like Zn-dependent dehydrogenase